MKQGQLDLSGINYHHEMLLDDFIKANPNIVEKRRGRWGIYHFNFTGYKGDYQAPNSLDSNSPEEVYEKLFTIIEG